MRLCIALLVASLAFGQGTLTLVPPSELSRQKELVERAWNEWQRDDRKLERDLLSLPPERALSRIESGKAAALAYLRHRRNYLRSLLDSFTDLIRGLEKPEAMEEIRGFDEAPKLELILEEQARLETQSGGARTTTLSGSLDAAERARQQEQLRQIVEKLEAQQKILRMLREAEQERRKVRALLLASYRRLAALLEQQLELNQEKQELWSRYYDDLRELINRESQGESLYQRGSRTGQDDRDNEKQEPKR